VGINCTHPDLGYLARVLDVAANRAPVYVGGPGHGLAALALGADGFLCSEANLAPRLCARVVDAFGTGDLEECFGAFGAVLRLSAALYERGGIRATKAVLAALGLPAGRVRPPQLGADAGAVADILQLLEALGVPAIEGWASHE
jgi:4-hydroxy-tetrahydrodipicolinate synthase